MKKTHRRSTSNKGSDLTKIRCARRSRGCKKFITVMAQRHDDPYCSRDCAILAREEERAALDALDAQLETG